jgi:hypothetical protein
LNEKMPHSINASAIKPIEKSSRQSPFITLPGRFLFDPFRRLVLELFATHRIDRLVFFPHIVCTVKACVYQLTGFSNNSFSSLCHSIPLVRYVVVPVVPIKFGC